ncbi:MAG TPA: putative glycoside hydrolase, partial [Byssovorax sp.]
QARAVLARADLAIVDAEVSALDPGGIRDVRARQGGGELLAYLTSEEIPREADEAERPLATARFDRIAPAFWLTEVGSTLVADVPAGATTFEVARPDAFRVHPVASDFYPADEPTYLLVGAEHVKLVGVEGSTLRVERGYRSSAVAHAAGEKIAAHVVFFSGTWMLNLASTAPEDPSTHTRWRDLVAEEAAGLVASGPWTGAFLDVCFDDISWLDGGRFDVDADGVADDPTQASRAWSDGMGLLIDALRAKIGDDAPIVANPGAENCPHRALDGILLEGWPIGLPREDLSFEAGLARYLDWSVTQAKPFVVANAFSPKIGFGVISPADDAIARRDFASMRFGLAVALMGDGYSSYDNGVFGHNVAWTYDEYDGPGQGWLGFPRGAMARGPGGLLTREFDGGFVIANPTSASLAATVPAGFARLVGAQDPAHNDGRPVDGPLNVDARDAYLLQRR